MFINPQDPQLGGRRQADTQEEIMAQIEEILRRRQSMSRFSRSGANTRQVRSRSPFRGAGSGIRAFAGGRPNRLGGFAQLLQQRGPERSAFAKQTALDEYGGPRIGTPTNPVDDLRVRVGGESPSPLPQSSGNVWANEALESGAVTFPNAQPGGPNPNKALLPGGNDAFGGLIPLGNGQWYDPATQSVMGRGSLLGMS